MSEIFAGLEAGGTKFNCIIASGPDEILSEGRFPTTTPDETLAAVIHFFQSEALRLRIQYRALGVATFGPVDLDPSSPTYGFITSTPKPHWGFANLLGPLQDALQVPAAFDTDVNGAAVGEGRWGAARGLQNFVYLTIGTGVGGGGVIGGKPMHGLVHPEMGHMLLRRDPARDPYPGACPFHGDCLEGLCAGPALAKRWGAPAETFGPDHPAWALEAEYIAAALHNLTCILSPQRIILGGGVMQQPFLFPMIRQELVRQLNGYVQSPAILQQIDRFVVPPGLGNRAGSLGSIAMAAGLAA